MSLRKLSLCFALLLLLPPIAAAQDDRAGQVVFVAGSVTVQRDNNARLKKTDPIFEGDVITTAAKSRGQLLMKDGAKFSLRPNTVFAVEEYFLSGDQRQQAGGAVVVAAENGAVTRLVKGGFRTITGAIGKDDPAEYVVNTPAATMGIRGTHYSAVWCAADCALADQADIDDGLYVGVTDGAVAITNDTGEFTVGAGQFYYVQDFSTAPVRLPRPPRILGDSSDAEDADEDETTEDTDEGSDESEESGEEADEGTDDGSGDGAEDGSDDGSDDGEITADGSDGSAESPDDAGDTSGSSETVAEAAQPATPAQEAASEIAETVVAIGDAATSVGLGGTSGSGDSSSGYSARATTPPGQTPGGTPDTTSDGSGTSGDSNGDGSEDDTASGDTSDADGTVASNDSGSSGSSGSSGAGSGTGSSGSSGSSSGSTGSGGSTAFGGPTTFGGGSSSPGGGTTSGGTTTSSEPPIPIMTESGMTIDSGELPGGRSVAVGSGPVSGLSASVFSGSSNLGARSFSGNDLTSFQSMPTAADTTYAIGTAAIRNDGFDPATGMGWGRWTGGTAQVMQPDGSAISVNLAQQSVHWIYGPDVVPVMPMTGTANYTLIAGNTDPTDTLGNTGALGSASLFADFTSATVETQVSLAINGNVWQAGGDGTITSNLFNGIYNSVFVDGIGGGSGNFAGFFGTQGANGLPAGAGLTYGLTDMTGTSVSGAVVFGEPSP